MQRGNNTQCREATAHSAERSITQPRGTQSVAGGQSHSVTTGAGSPHHTVGVRVSSARAADQSCVLHAGCSTTQLPAAPESQNHTAGSSAENTADSSAENTAGSSAENTAESSAEHTTGNSAEHIADSSAEHTAGNNAEHTAGSSAENTLNSAVDHTKQCAY